jgi:hypothetical protein
MLGLIAWDLASFVTASDVFGTDCDRAEKVLNGYGRSFNVEALELCIEARTFVALV